MRLRENRELVSWPTMEPHRTRISRVIARWPSILDSTSAVKP